MSASQRPESLLGIAARDLERLGQVTATLVRHGFGALVGRGAEPGGRVLGRGCPLRLAPLPKLFRRG